MEKRYLEQQVFEDLQRKMVFVGGPRQVGKTTLARRLLADASGYLNWDVARHREDVLKGRLPEAPMWVFDEIHKYSEWRNWLKGVYDQFGDTHQILVTGSARLDLYRRGGDSLQGRYHYLQLNPLSVSELGIVNQKELMGLLTLGGFPEPFFSGSEHYARRWSREYRQRLVQEDIVTLERTRELSKIEHLVLRLPELVGSPLSVHALCEDLQVSHNAVSHWIEILKRLYAIITIPPFGAKPLRALKKAQKHYHYDWSLVTEAGAKFENMVAIHLLKWVQFQQDVEGRDIELKYFRDVDGREVDFIITDQHKPVLAIECKTSDGDVSKGLKYFKQHFKSCEAVQIALKGERHLVTMDQIRLMPALDFLKDFL